MNTKLIISFCLLILVVVFSLQNSVSVPVRFIVWKTELPVALIIIISLSFGIIMGLLYSIPRKKPAIEKTEKDEALPLT